MIIGINLAVSIRGTVFDLLNQTTSPSPCVHDNFLKQNYRNYMQYKKIDVGISKQYNNTRSTPKSPLTSRVN